MQPTVGSACHACAGSPSELQPMASSSTDAGVATCSHGYSEQDGLAITTLQGWHASRALGAHHVPHRTADPSTSSIHHQCHQHQQQQHIGLARHTHASSRPPTAHQSAAVHMRQYTSQSAAAHSSSSGSSSAAAAAPRAGVDPAQGFVRGGYTVDMVRRGGEDIRSWLRAMAVYD